MVGLKAAELDIVDALIAAGIADNRAPAICWALGSGSVGLTGVADHLWALTEVAALPGPAG
jgi:hypothetical protein